MENKSKNNNFEDESHLPPDVNPVDNTFYDADDPKFRSNDTTGSGFSEAEREVHDGHSPGKPADPQS
ncbi:MAG TPA: hypothetical protein VF581_11115 [Flavobacterium sp.]|jgi:hypothetical protein